jgi:hypothetical protein
VGAEVIQDHGLSRSQMRGEELVTEGGEHRARRRAGMGTAVAIPVGPNAARRVTFGPWLRWPRGARARSRVKAVWVLVSSTNTRSSGTTAAVSVRQASRRRSLRSVAIGLFV